ncbi:MAG: hypothetical protein ABGW82_12970 [Paracoccus sp. (in: a-proteobacteria)]|jgi:hypothetical protein|uniref:hypothetical protein n=1 Tax=unclassified Paracoccus (in: a-proteobacteria) TaxID=2688777 RepID=UPI000C52E960|nr:MULTISPECIES: hypothetical protein [unclassified Paracoccus (in: a-proteobacteria)]MAN55023.1 hypothetical protein [Paracoccus sp. (in: a-proteobacteria)]MDB2490432.1 hypothetical protein [Paracoccus sp. (in: a-proteobacteria)]HIC65853.1 hypothetical protein [Paracoccus sp. (in: a-proteobacteria)]|tara:strand:+ start:2567 stop:2752 length:186 start_codon:yes stop_codon:yes gene_type:complete
MSERVPPTDAQQQISAYDRQLAEIDKLLGEARNYKAEARWYVWVVASGGTLAIVAFAKLFL